MSSKGISIREFARRRGLTDRAIRKAIAAGRLRTFADGTLDPALVGGGGTASAPAKSTRPSRKSPARGSVAPASEAAPADDLDPEAVVATLDEFAERVLSGDMPPLAEAERAKQSALALKHVLDARQKAGELVSVAAAEDVFFRDARSERDAWLNWPVKVGPRLAAELGIADVDKVTHALGEHVYRQLAELGEPQMPELSSVEAA